MNKEEIERIIKFWE